MSIMIVPLTPLLMVSASAYRSRPPIASDTAGKCLCAVRFAKNLHNIGSLGVKPQQPQVSGRTAAIQMNAYLGRLRDYNKKVATLKSSCALCKGSDWHQSFCGNVPACDRSIPATCFAKESIQSRPVCVKEEDLALAAPLSREKDDTWYRSYEVSQEETLEAFVAFQLQQERRILPSSENSSTSQRKPCEADGVYRGRACDNQADFQAIGMHDERIPEGMGVCLDKVCYDLRDVIELRGRAVDEHIQVPHSRLNVSVHDLDVILPRAAQTILLEECEGCDSEKEDRRSCDPFAWISKQLLGTSPCPCTKPQDIASFLNGDIWQGAKSKNCTSF